MSEINLYFPTPIYTHTNLFDKEQNEQWSNAILKLQETVPSGGQTWQGNTYTTHETYNLLTDNMFLPLIESVTSHVDAFTNEFISDYEHTCQSAWGNVNMPGTFQEYHVHPSSVFSCVYYPKVPENSGDIVFESPLIPDMMPVKNISSPGNLNFERINIPPQEGLLIIFRSYLRHCVNQGFNTEPRISIALNYS